MPGFLSNILDPSSEKFKFLTKFTKKMIGLPELDAIPGLAESIEDGSFLKALPGLVSNDYLPADILKSGFDPSKLLGESGPLKKFLNWSEVSNFQDAVKSFMELPDCGGTILGEPDDAPDENQRVEAFNRANIDLNGRQPIVWHCETTDGLLPDVKVKDDQGPWDEDPEYKDLLSRSFLDSLALWKGPSRLKLDFAPGTAEEANLLVSGRTGGFGANVVAVGDIGPLNKKKCRLIFNLGVSSSRDEFQYTVAHEFGHCLGISHANVPRQNALMSPLMDLSRGIEPGEEDLKAAGKFWERE